MTNLNEILGQKIARLREESTLRTLKDTERLKKGHIARAGESLLSFSCNDYLDLARDKRVIKAANAAATKYGAGSGASRLITGNHPLYTELETNLARALGAEASAVYGSGYLANIGVITALVGSGDLILADKLSHSCIIDGSQLSNAEFRRFEHNDLAKLDAMLERHRRNYRNCLVITEAVFSMDGDVPEMEKLYEICRKHNAWLLTDHAHDIQHFSNSTPQRDNHIVMGTFSKAFGSYGGYVAGSQELVDYLKTASRSLMFTTGLPPAVVAASIKSLELAQAEPERAQKALTHAEFFRKALKNNLKSADMCNSSTQIVPLIIGRAAQATEISAHLAQDGFLVHAIRPPTVPANTSRLRFSFSAAHDKTKVDELAKLIIRYFNED